MADSHPVKTFWGSIWKNLGAFAQSTFARVIWQSDHLWDVRVIWLVGVAIPITILAHLWLVLPKDAFTPPGHSNSLVLPQPPPLSLQVFLNGQTNAVALANTSLLPNPHLDATLPSNTSGTKVDAGLAPSSQPHQQHLHFTPNAGPLGAGAQDGSKGNDDDSSHQLEWAILYGAAAMMVGLTGWAYQTASNRLGAIDLFGCEISALCRVFWVVDFARGTVTWLGRSKETRSKMPWVSKGICKSQSLPGGQKKRYMSEENYTPVYDKRLTDLQPLSADVVTAITEFYTYRKTMIDYLRMVFEQTEGTEQHVRYVRQMLYMQFLMYESGHKAVKRLIEYEPNRAESLINIYCLELVAYQCLTEEYKELNRQNPPGAYDYLVARLSLRKKHYCEEIPPLCNSIDAKPEESGIHWERAKTSNMVLKRRFCEVFKDQAGKLKHAPPSEVPAPHKTEEPLSIESAAEAILAPN